MQWVLCSNFNQTLSQLRISAEYVIRELKKFNIIGGNKRERCERFELRMKLLTGIDNGRG